jgi:hypothetical protein
VHVISATGSAWSYGGAVLTFLLPMLLFIFVAGWLYVAYSTPHMVPGQRYEVARRSSPAATAPVRVPGQAGEHGAQPAPAADGGPAAGAAGDD